MAYEWQNSISSGTLMKDEFYSSISSTYTTVINNHCPGHYTGYNASVYSNKTDNSSVTNCSANDTTDKTSHHTGYTCTTDRSHYATHKTSQKSSDKASHKSSNKVSDYNNKTSDYSSNLSTNKSSNYSTNKSSNWTSDVADSDK